MLCGGRYGALLWWIDSFAVRWLHEKSYSDGEGAYAGVGVGEYPWLTDQASDVEGEQVSQKHDCEHCEQLVES